MRKAGRKRGDDSGPISWFMLATFFYLIFLSIVMYSTRGLFYTIKGNTVGIPESVEIRSDLSRFIIAENCLAYRDSETGRTYAAIMDLSKFQSNNPIRDCYNELAGDWAFRLSLQKTGEDKKSEITTAFYDGKKQNLLKFRRPVLIKDGEQIVQGELTIYAQR